MKKIFFFLAFFLSFAQTVFAAPIFTSDINGTQKTSFYTNETVYLAPSTANITTNSTSVRIYIMQDSTTWSNQTNLTDLSGGGYKTFTTNDTGYLNKTNIIWPATLVVANYDVIADTNTNGVYDQGIDFIYDTSAIGFQVIPIPGASITVSVGENSTANHTYTIPSNNTENAMLQLKITSGSYENTKINTLGIVATGTGDDSKGITIVKLILDEDNDGVYDQGEQLLAFGQYIHDDGVIQLSIPNGYTLHVNTTVYFLVVYTMSNSSLNGETYSFQVASLTGTGVTSETNAKVALPLIYSATTTISASLGSTTTTTSTITTSVSSSIITTTSTTTNQNLPNFMWIYIAAAISVTIVFLFVILYIRASRTTKYEYKP
jgi:hypothetical protein